MTISVIVLMYNRLNAKELGFVIFYIQNTIPFTYTSRGFNFKQNMLESYSSAIDLILQ